MVGSEPLPHKETGIGYARLSACAKLVIRLMVSYAFFEDLQDKNITNFVVLIRLVYNKQAKFILKWINYIEA